MFDSREFLEFVGAVVVLVLVPGPNTIIILAHGLTGRINGLATVAGVELGTLFHTLAAALGLSALLMTSRFAFNAVKFAGAGYLIAVGIRTMMQPPPQLAGPSLLRPAVAFRRALFTNVLNPKSALFFLAFLPHFVRPEHGHVFAQFMLLGMTVSLVGICIGSTLALTAGSLSRWLERHSAFGRWEQRLMGAALIGLAIRLATASSK